MTQDEFLSLALRNPVNKIIADELFRLALPDAWIVSGCLVQTVWNVLTGRDRGTGIKDYDVIYFDDSDLSWADEGQSYPRRRGRDARLRWASRSSEPSSGASVVRGPIWHSLSPAAFGR